MLSDAAWAVIARSLNLPQRQLEIIRAVFDDATEYTIAQNLGISPHTVHTHLERIHHKLGVHDRVELVLLVLAEFLRLTADAASDLPPVCGRRAAGECPFQRKRNAAGN
jgi:DNA-binding CsgD family transcriptional regulator